METKAVSLFHLFSFNTHAPLSQKQIFYTSPVIFNLSSQPSWELYVFIKDDQTGKSFHCLILATLCHQCAMFHWGDISDRFWNKLRLGICEWEFPLEVWLEMGALWFWSTCLVLLFIYKGRVRHKCEKSRKYWRKSQGEYSVIGCTLLMAFKYWLASWTSLC